MHKPRDVVPAFYFSTKEVETEASLATQVSMGWLCETPIPTLLKEVIFPHTEKLRKYKWQHFPTGERHAKLHSRAEIALLSLKTPTASNHDHNHLRTSFQITMYMYVCMFGYKFVHMCTCVCLSFAYTWEQLRASKIVPPHPDPHFVVCLMTSLDGSLRTLDDSSL